MTWRAVGQAVFTIWLVVSATFLLLQILPGDAIQAQFAQSGASSDVVDARRAVLGLDQPVWRQYVSFWIALARGDLGESLYSGETVSQIIVRGLAITLPLASLSLVFAIVLGLLLGVVAAIDSWIRPIVALIMDLSLGVPVYWTATVTLYVVAARLGSLQTGLMLPVLVLGYHSAGVIAQISAVTLRESRSAAYLRTARGKGLHNQTIFVRHALPNLLAVILPVIALQSGALFSGTVLTETIFQRSGLGLLLWDAVLERDYPVVQGIVVVIACTYVFLNATANWLTVLIDPRLRGA